MHIGLPAGRPGLPTADSYPVRGSTTEVKG